MFTIINNKAIQQCDLLSLTNIDKNGNYNIKYHIEALDSVSSHQANCIVLVKCMKYITILTNPAPHKNII